MHTPRLWLSITVGLLLAACSSATPATRVPTPSLVLAALSIDCTAANPACRPLTIMGDAPATLAGGAPSPARGFADASIRKDPASSRLWMAYSWPHITGTGRAQTVTVDSHLAHSDDGGATWTFDRTLWTSTAENDPTTRETGYSNNETVSLAPRQTLTGVVWYSVRLRYFTRVGGYKFNTFQLRVASATSPQELATSTEGILGGSLTPKEWDVDTDLSKLSPEVADCTWSDPGLLFEDASLYLAVQCFIVTPRGEQVAREFVALFSTRPDGPAPDWKWSYSGKLATRADAVAMGGESFTQTDLAYAQDGTLLLIVSPSKPGQPLEAHTGCVALEIASLTPPTLARDAAGRPKLRASVTASDLGPQGPGACGYDPASSTGIVIMRRQLGLGQLIGELYATGLRP